MANDSSVMQSFELTDLLNQHESAGKLYLEFLKVPALSTGIYKLTAGSTDPQQPHDQDEVYYVIAGRGSFTCEGETIACSPGTTIYVAAEAAHRFHDIAEELTILVFFAPAEN
jgi:mannose-6-phosphate isomerase-like protein (cupin superfamily)